MGTIEKKPLNKQLLEAVERKDLREVQELLRKGADPSHVSCTGTSALHLAAGIQKETVALNLVRMMLQKCSNPNVRSDERLTPVHVASLRGNQRVLELLLSFGGNPWLCDSDGDTSFTLAVKFRKDGVKKYLDGYSSEFSDDGRPSSPPCLVKFNRFLTSRELKEAPRPQSLEDKKKGALGDPKNEAFVASDGDSCESSSDRSSLFEKAFVDTDSLCSKFAQLNASVRTEDETDLDRRKPGSGGIQYAGALGKKPSTQPLNTMAEEYIHSDADENLVFVERRLPKGSGNEDSDNSGSTFDDWKTAASSDPSGTSSAPESIRRLDDDALRDNIRRLGGSPGPITPSTLGVYRNYYHRLRKGNKPKDEVKRPKYSTELIRVLEGIDKIDVSTWSTLEQDMLQFFLHPPPGSRWAGAGQNKKTSYNYLLLDPRVTANLPSRLSLTNEEAFQIFVSSIFYVGKGQGSRTFAHLYEALKHKLSGNGQSNSKVSHILDIWNDGKGVISLRAFQHTIQEEAFTREASMIDALGLNNLCNLVRGRYFGPVTTWIGKKRRQLGTHLLYKAYLILKLEGERQIFPCDL